MTYIQPVLLLLIGMILLGWHPRTRQWFGPRNWILPAAALLLFLWSWAPTGVFLSKTLEGWYTPGEMPPADAEAIVVLGAGAKALEPPDGGAIAGFRTIQRCHHAVWLYENWKAVPILVSGGDAGLDLPGRAILADIMSHELSIRGIPPESVWREDTSQSTYTNAVHSCEILKRRGISKIVLVTDAHHMLRAELSFRGQGIEVVPSPCRFISSRLPRKLPDYFPDSDAVEINESVLHEWAGVVWYWLSGRF